MWFRLECGIGEIQPQCSWLQAGLFAPAAESFSYGAIKSSFRCDAIELTWDDGESLDWDVATRELHSQ